VPTLARDRICAGGTIGTVGPTPAWGLIRCPLWSLSRWIARRRTAPCPTTLRTASSWADPPSAATGKIRSSLTSSRTGRGQRRRDKRSWKTGSNGLLVWARHACESTEQNNPLVGSSILSPGTNKLRNLGSVFERRSSQKLRLGSPWEAADR
jgi:hypothetical protein